MPSTNSPRPRTSAKSRKRRRRKRRGPVIRFKFGKLILIWVLCLIAAVLLYMLSRNLHPEKNVFRKGWQPGESSVSDSAADIAPVITPSESSLSENSSAESSTAENSTAESSAEESGEGGEESSQVPTTNKVNPVPETAARPADYLKTCAFVGEVDIYRMGESGQLQEKSFYASEEINLTNYGSEYVLLDGTTIHIQSAMYAAKCPIYLMFGTEDLAAGQPADQTADQFSVLLGLMKASAPEATFYVLSIPPVTKNGEKTAANSVIDEYNSLLLQISNENDVYFVDTNTALKNNEGRLDSAYADEDGIHLNAVGRETLLNYVLSHVPA